jgi:hypothetical protein
MSAVAITVSTITKKSIEKSNPFSSCYACHWTIDLNSNLRIRTRVHRYLRNAALQGRFWVVTTKTIGLYSGVENSPKSARFGSIN